MRTKNVLRNSFWGIIAQFTTIVLGFVGRTVFIKTLATEYLGINGLFTNILMLMSLAELGVGTAIEYNLYKPVADNEEAEITGLINLFKEIYRLIALFIFILGICIIPFLGNIIKESSFDISYLRIVFSLYLLQTVSSYFFAYKFVILNVNQKQYVITNTDTIFRIASTGVNIIILILTKNFIFYTVFNIFSAIIRNIILSSIIDRRYPYLKKNNTINREKRRNVFEDTKNIFIGRLSYTILTATDNIVISAFINILTVGLFSNYTMLIGYINGFIGSITGSTQPSIGNMLVTESKEYSYNIIKKMTFIIFILASYCSVSILCLINPFIKIWIGRGYLLGFFTVAVCVVNFYIQLIKGPLWQTLSVSGLFKKDKYISIIGAISNIAFSIILVQLLGVAGVILGTIISQTIQLIMKIILLFRQFLKISYREYSLIMILYFLITAIECGVSFWICSLINLQSAIFSLLLKAFLCLIIPNIVNYLIFFKTEEFKYARDLVSSILIRRKEQSPLVSSK